jgi:hypothetical protein
MKTALRISIWLNLGLVTGLFLILLSWRQQEAAAPVLSELKPPVQMAAASTPLASSVKEPEPFRWSQLLSAKDYGIYIANLRAIGCPEATIEDIVRGDTARAYSWERSQLGLDGSGAGPWSRQAEMQLVASLLGEQTAYSSAPAQNTENQKEANGPEAAQTSMTSHSERAGAPAYPLFLQNANWNALGFNAEQQAAITQVRQQFLGEVDSLNQNSSSAATQNPNSANPGATAADPNPNASAPLAQWQQALQDADNQLRDLLGGQGYMAYEQQQYYAWYQPQVVAASAGGGNLTINPDSFSLK